MRSTADLVSQVCDPRYINPQTGPFYVDGARPGDTLGKQDKFSARGSLDWRPAEHPALAARVG